MVPRGHARMISPRQGRAGGVSEGFATKRSGCDGKLRKMTDGQIAKLEKPQDRDQKPRVQGTTAFRAVLSFL